MKDHRMADLSLWNGIDLDAIGKSLPPDFLQCFKEVLAEKLPDFKQSCEFLKMVDTICRLWDKIPEQCRKKPNKRLTKSVLRNLTDLEPNEETLREMFANLLAGSMDTRRSDQAHPAYATVIASLSEDDAKCLQALWENKAVSAIRSRNTNIDTYQYYIQKSHALNETQLSSMIDRLEAQGLIDTESSGFASSYNGDESFPRIRKDYNLEEHQGQNLKITLTSYGRAFMQAVT